MSKELYNQKAKELGLREVTSEHEVVNFNYLPNYQMLTNHEKTVELCLSAEIVVRDDQAIKNLIQYHESVLGDLRQLQTRPLMR